MNSHHRVYPGIYMVGDPEPGRARALVRSMVQSAGTVHDRIVAVEGPGFALAAVSPPVDEPSCGPGLHCDGQGVLIWAGEMFLPESWHGQTEPPSPRTVAAIVRHKLVTCGPAILAEIDGSFCGAWFDEAAHTWTVFNDRWGLMPLFWWSQGPRVVVSPRARLTWQASDTQLDINSDGVADLLRTQNMLDDHTLITGVHWLEPAHNLAWNGRGRTPRSLAYWNFEHRPVEPPSYKAAMQGYLDAAQPTLARMTSIDSPVLQGLSGGLDSRLFLALCHERGCRPACYTSGFAFGEDVRFARQLARIAGCSHDLLLLDSRTFLRQLRDSIMHTDGLHGAGHLILSTPINEYLAQHEGGVLLEGYLHGVLGGSDLPADADVPAHLPAHQHSWAIDFLHAGGAPAKIDTLLREELAYDSAARWQAHVDDAFGRAATDDPLCRAEYAIITGRSGRNDVLVPAMPRNHVLTRHPACDRRMLEWYATTPARLRRARRPYVDVLREHYPEFARVPRADGCSGMPLTDGRWRREYAWQCEKLYSRWAWLRYPEVRRWGRDSMATRAWGFDICRQAGLFEPLLTDHARVREWVKPRQLRSCFEAACRDAQPSVVLLTLLTIETMVRELERTESLSGHDAGPSDSIEFRKLSVGQVAGLASVGADHPPTPQLAMAEMT